jgi:hypothetical protein
MIGNIEAVELYKIAFSVELGYNVKNSDGTYPHAEIVLNHQTIVSLSESNGWSDSSLNMQFCVNFGKGNKMALSTTYEVLKDSGQIHSALGPCDWNESMTDLSDKFGVRWYLAV